MRINSLLTPAFEMFREAWSSCGAVDHSRYPLGSVARKTACAYTGWLANPALGVLVGFELRLLASRDTYLQLFPSPPTSISIHKRVTYWKKSPPRRVVAENADSSAAVPAPLQRDTQRRSSHCEGRTA